MDPDLDPNVFFVLQYTFDLKIKNKFQIHVHQKGFGSGRIQILNPGTKAENSFLLSILN